LGAGRTFTAIVEKKEKKAPGVFRQVGAKYSGYR